MGGGGGRSYTRVHKPYTSPLSEVPKGTTKSIFDEDDECSKVSFSDTLQNISLSAISRISKDDILRVQLKPAGGSVTVVVINDAGDICGYLTSPQAVKLIECLQKGILYSAKVLGISGSTITVHVSKKK
ncbi:hypothetical protein [Pedobacter psychrodurus]|uniref:hypothetical protein n=1 Tax=Pedobacter psychrodurus TaxID=2530456 RepID=UPI0029304CA2|nr:hypothetical protein [Pedobacter psychrodurus]